MTDHTGPRPGRHNELSGTVHGDPTMINAENVYVTHAEPIPPTGAKPRTAPAVVGQRWVNRKDFFRALHAALIDTESPFGPRLGVVQGDDDIGRTAATAAWSKQVEPNFPDGTLYCDINDHTVDGVVVAHNVLLCLLTQLEPRKTDHWQPKFSDLQAHWRSATAKSGLLTILDNLEDPAVFADVLPNGSECSVVVISRYNVKGLVQAGATRILLQKLSEDHCLELLGNYCGPHRVNAEERVARDLVRDFEYLPSLIITAGADLEDNPELALEDYRQNTVGKVTNAGSIKDISQEVVSRSLQHNLSDAQSQLLRRLCAHPGRDFSTALANWLHGGDATQELTDLMAAKLVNQAGGPDRWRLADTLTTFDFGDLTQRSVLDKICQFYLASSLNCDIRAMGAGRLRIHDLVECSSPLLFRPSTAAEGLRWLLVERHNIDAIQQSLFDIGRFTPVWALEEYAWWPLRQSYPAVDISHDTTNRSVTAAQLDGNLMAEARMRQQKANTLIWRQDFAAATEQLDIAVELARASSNRRLEASVVEFQAVGKKHQGDYASAIEKFDFTLAVNLELNQTRGAAVQRWLRGDCYQATERLDDADDDLALALPVFQNSDEPTHHTGHVLASQAKVLAKRQDFIGAVDTTDTAVTAFHRAGAPAYIATTYTEVGNLLALNGSAHAAAQCWQRGLDSLIDQDNGSSQLAQELRKRLPANQGPDPGLGSRSE